MEEMQSATMSVHPTAPRMSVTSFSEAPRIMAFSPPMRASETNSTDVDHSSPGSMPEKVRRSRVRPSSHFVATDSTNTLSRTAASSDAQGYPPASRSTARL
jgi:hypothetical protein